MSDLYGEVRFITPEDRRQAIARHAGRGLSGLTPAEKRREQAERRYKMHYLDMLIAGVVTVDEHKQTLARLDRAPRRRAGR